MTNVVIFRFPSKPSTDSMKIEITTYGDLFRNRLYYLHESIDKRLT